MFTSVLPERAQNALAVLGQSGICSDAYLAGGTALALQLGHRESIDFDFFTSKQFDPIKLGKSLPSVGSFSQTTAKGISLIGEFNNVKMSYFHYDYPLLEKTTQFQGIEIAHPNDIAAMKLVAISDRNTKKDYIDLYVLAHNGVPFDVMFEFYEKKYHAFDANKFTIIKSMTYFQEADEDEMPKMLSTITWQEVKEYFLAESMRLGKKFLENVS